MSDGASFFVDTNVLLYSLDVRSDRKRQQAREWLSLLWGFGRIRLTWQVIHEFYSNSIRKLTVPPVEARQAVEKFVLWGPNDIGLRAIERAWYWMDTAQVSYWDGLILASAEQADCKYLLSEDFQAGRTYGDVTVVNPFQQSPDEFGLQTH
jgi:predicted nucleic acid-binding protein